MKLISTLVVLSGLTALLAGAAQAAPHGVFYTKQMQAKLKRMPHRAGKNNVIYYGGPVIANVKAISVMWGNKVNATTQAQIADFFTATVNSTYMDWMTEYNTDLNGVNGKPGTNQTIGRGTFAGQFVITPKNKSKKLKDADIQAELEFQIENKALPEADDNTLYMVYFPPGVSITIDGMTSCQSFCAYHEGFQSQKNGNIFYGVMPDLGGACSFGCGFQPTPFDALTDVSSHELMEAISDPFPTPGSKPDYPQAWNTTDGQEIGDLCAQSSAKLSSSKRDFVVQTEWSNKQGGCTPGPFHNP